MKIENLRVRNGLAGGKRTCGWKTDLVDENKEIIAKWTCEWETDLRVGNRLAGGKRTYGWETELIDEHSGCEMDLWVENRLAVGKQTWSMRIKKILAKWTCGWKTDLRVGNGLDQLT